MLYGLLVLTQQPHRESEGAWRLIKMRHARGGGVRGQTNCTIFVEIFGGLHPAHIAPQTTVRDLSVRCRNTERRRKSPCRSHYVVECVHTRMQSAKVVMESAI